MTSMLSGERYGGYVPKKNEPKTILTKRQNKARAKAKRAKMSRKINRPK